MNYRHIFHAGNLCDTVKHAVLTLILGHMRTKETPFCVLDTHAGIGLYDLQDERALKTGEAKSGILKLLDAPHLPELASWYETLKSCNPEWDGASSASFRYYPGSPLLALQGMRPQDRLIACELHPEDAASLKHQLRRHRQAQTHERDGYEALNAFLPPTEKRSLVLIDPPFEQQDEYARLAAALQAAHARWPQGIYMVWYPVKERPAIWRFHEALVALQLPKTLAAEWVYREEIRADCLNGSGLILVNTPWQMDEKLRHLFAYLHENLQTPSREFRLNWLTAA